MSAEYTILTPEKVAVEFRLAGVGSRVGAYLLDLFIIYAGIYGFLQFGALLAGVAPGLFYFLVFILLLGAFCGYHALCEALWNGKTVGKLAAGIRVKMADGSPVTPAAAFMRNALRLADALPGIYTVGLCAMFFTEKGQRIGDIVANTVVVKERRNTEPISASSALSAQAHPLEHLVEGMKSISMEEYAAIKTLCDRYPELPPGIRDRLVKEVWMPVANRFNMQAYSDVHPVYLMEAVVMNFARRNGLL